MKDLAFKLFALLMGTLIGFAGFMVIWSAGYLFKWWS